MTPLQVVPKTLQQINNWGGDTSRGTARHVLRDGFFRPGGE
jgi:hypothetical protein